MFYFQIFTLKLNLLPKIGLTYAIIVSYSKVALWNFCLRKYFLLFFSEFKLLMFHNNIEKISENLNKQNLLKICLQIIYGTLFLYFLHSFFTMGKSETIWFL